jgi:hypothetical protein
MVKIVKDAMPIISLLKRSLRKSIPRAVTRTAVLSASENL